MIGVKHVPAPRCGSSCFYVMSKDVPSFLIVRRFAKVISRTNELFFEISGFFVPHLDLNFVMQSAIRELNPSSQESIEDRIGSEEYFDQLRMKNIYQNAPHQQDSKKPFNCPKCGRRFTVKGNMTRHLKYECGQEPQFQCPYCEFRSKQTSNVMSHIRTRHIGERVYVVHLKY